MRKKILILNLLSLGVLMNLFLFTGCEKEDLQVPEVEVNQLKEELQLKSTVSEGTFIIMNRNSGKSLDVNTSNNNVQQYSYWGGSNQKWTLTDVGSGYYRISPVSNSGHAIDVEGQSTDNAANIQTYTYWAGANQQWQFVDIGDGYYSIINRNSGKALDVYNSSANNGANIIQYDYQGTSNQQWSLISLSGSGSGQISWILTSSNVPSDVEALITSAMDAAVARYNSWANWSSRTLTVEYNTGVATADGSLSGNIRFGSNTAYMTERTALHEIAHTYGVGTSSSWAYPLIQDYIFVGENAASLLKTFDGSDAVINTGGQHFWPYGLNYESEMSETNADRHVQIVRAMVEDGIYP
jgi:hypothetical protein